MKAQDWILPYLKYDGMMLGLHQFTEYDSSRVSYGASFYLKTTDLKAVAVKREEKRVEFDNGLKKKDSLTASPS